METENERPQAGHQLPQEPYEPPRAEDLEAAENTVATASGDFMTPPSDSGVN